MPTVSRHVSASASGSASKRAPTAPGLGLQDAGGDLGGRGEPCGSAAALGRRWRVAHNSTGPTTAKRDTHLTRKRSGLHLTNALLWSRVSGPPLLIGSVALAVILFEGGLKTPVSMLRLAFRPAAVLATIGVGVTAGILGAVVSLRAARGRVRAQRPDVGVLDRPFAAPDCRTGLDRRRRCGPAVPRANDRWCRTRRGGRLGARAVAEAVADRSTARSGPGADRWARRVRVGSTHRHQRLPCDLPGRGDHRCNAAPRAPGRRAFLRGHGVARADRAVLDARSAGD